jgi:hypothetical protein
MIASRQYIIHAAAKETAADNLTQYRLLGDGCVPEGAADVELSTHAVKCKTFYLKPKIQHVAP